MRTYYVVLWMPTVVHADFDWLYKQETDVFEISDGLTADNLKEGDSCLFAHIEIDNTKSFTVSIYEDKDRRQHLENESFALTYLLHSHNGLFKYRLVIPDEGNALIKVDENGVAVFPCDIYNRLKEFYHHHNYHAVDDGDSIIKPFVTTDDINIKQENNAALRHYLSEYDKKFTRSFLMLSSLYDLLIQKKRWTVYVKLMMGKGKHGPFYQMATAIKGDKTYCNTLLNSCYNKFAEMEVAEDAPEEEINRIRECVKESKRQKFNIENITRSVGIMVERINNHFSLSTSLISFWLALFAIVLSILFFILSK